MSVRVCVPVLPTRLIAKGKILIHLYCLTSAFQRAPHVCKFITGAQLKAFEVILAKLQNTRSLFSISLIRKSYYCILSRFTKASD